MKKLSRTQSIRQMCLGCAGDSPKEVTLCHIFDCPLWQYRCGYSIDSTQYKKRIESAKERFPKEFEDLLDMGVDVPFFFGNPPKNDHSQKNSE